MNSCQIWNIAYGAFAGNASEDIRHHCHQWRPGLMDTNLQMANGPREHIFLYMCLVRTAGQEILTLIFICYATARRPKYTDDFVMLASNYVREQIVDYLKLFDPYPTEHWYSSDCVIVPMPVMYPGTTFVCQPRKNKSHQRKTTTMNNAFKSCLTFMMIWYQNLSNICIRHCGSYRSVSCIYIYIYIYIMSMNPNISYEHWQLPWNF